MLLLRWLFVIAAASVAARDIHQHQKPVAISLVALSLFQDVSAYNERPAGLQGDVPSIAPRKFNKDGGWPRPCGRRGGLFRDVYGRECGEENEHYRNVHGIIMATVVLILFPIGALSMRLLGRWWLHAGLQILSLFLLIAGFGIGIYLAKIGHKLFNNTHTILGTVVVVLFATAQPMLGFLQHTFFRTHRKRGPSGHAHLWLGRVLIVLGVVNGGLGLRLVDDERDGKWRNIYIGIAVAMAVLYVIIVIGTALFKGRRLTK